MQNHPISSRQAMRLPLHLRSIWLALTLCFLCAMTATFAPAANAQNTAFLSNTGDVLTDGDDYYYRAFTINRKTTFDLRFAPDYNSDCVILSPNYLNAFISGASY
ncbi:MAG: hypothetical protein EOP06_25825, partial [Proteobacteria bacterium]